MLDTLTIDRTLTAYDGDGPLCHLWSISIDGRRIAELWVDTDTGEIANVWTREDHREQGHATALYRRANTDLNGAIYHAPEAHRTDDGDRFAARVGGPALTCTCCTHLDDGDDDYDRS